ncbi:MAG: D-alanyl-D-alanine carboxypeptidase/D-alanyl-D-alanine-endopeptidase [Actinomycetota bacterium]|nr:D-alanyl-D-alanine carboxypeptidase/D-alanyl-D-alanine-endopeptidase [Actinomycetota bacterium]
MRRPALSPIVTAAALSGVLAAGAGAVPSAVAAPPAASVVASLGTVATASTTVAADDPRTAAERAVATKLSNRIDAPDLGSDVRGRVIDLATGRRVWSKGSDDLRIPASTAKLATALATLRVFDPASRLTTTVARGSAADRVVVIGAGDPSLSSADLAAAADAAATDLTARGHTSAVVEVDDTLFPAPSAAPGWQPGYVPEQVRWVRALVVDERHATDTSLDAGSVFGRMLAARGINVRAVVHATAPADAHVLARAEGRTMGEIVQRMLLRSDNDHAEALFRLTAIRTGAKPTWSGAAAATRALLAELRLPLTGVVLHDGSGLSRDNRVTPRLLVRMIRRSETLSYEEYAPIRDGGLPLAGRTGSLSASLERFTTWPSSCAAGKLTGKTGNLTGAQSLAGVAQGSDGRRRVYAFIVSGKPATLETKQAVDRLAATVTGCW